MKKKHSPEQIVKKLQEADGLRAAGMTVPDACRQLEIAVATYHQLVGTGSGWRFLGHNAHGSLVPVGSSASHGCVAAQL